MIVKDHKSDLYFLHLTRGPLSSVYTGFLTLALLLDPPPSSTQSNQWHIHSFTCPFAVTESLPLHSAPEMKAVALRITGSVSLLQYISLGMRNTQVCSQGIRGRNTWQLIPSVSHVWHNIPYSTVHICLGLSLPSQLHESLASPLRLPWCHALKIMVSWVFESWHLLPSTSIRREVGPML